MNGSWIKKAPTWSIVMRWIYKWMNWTSINENIPELLHLYIYWHIAEKFESLSSLSYLQVFHLLKYKAYMQAFSASFLNQKYSWYDFIIWQKCSIHNKTKKSVGAAEVTDAWVVTELTSCILDLPVLRSIRLKNLLQYTQETM